LTSGRFPAVSVRHWSWIIGKNLTMPAGILFLCSSYFRCFPAGYDDFSRTFSAGSGEIRLFSETVVIDEGRLFITCLVLWSIYSVIIQLTDSQK
jgi:hypothetical protein